MDKILLTLANDMIAPRFDLATEVLIVSVEDKKIFGTPKSMLLPGPSADDLCSLILKEEISVLICGGIEDEHYQFLSWKKVKVIDRIIGKTKDILQRLPDNKLRAGEIVRQAGKAKERGGK